MGECSPENSVCGIRRPPDPDEMCKNCCYRECGGRYCLDCYNENKKKEVKDYEKQKKYVLSFGKIPKYCVNMPCERCILGGRRSQVRACSKARKVRAFSYKGYALIQNPSGNYYIVDRKTSRWVMHAQCEELLTRKEAREHIKFYLYIKKN